MNEYGTSLIRKLAPMKLCDLGGEYDNERKMDDLKLLYRAYITDALSSSRMEENKVTNHSLRLLCCFTFSFFLHICDLLFLQDLKLIDCKNL